MELSVEERAVLAHVVIDPDVWVARAEATFGKEKALECLREKVARWKPDYNSKLLAQGKNYKTRIEREALNPLSHISIK
jgi:hypothetical protein